MNAFSALPKQYEEYIKNFINEKFTSENLLQLYPNKLLREDVLELLEKYCKVIYFPLDNENNNGFHIKDVPFADGEVNNFVFINTAQTTEKQVFTAAHELGHIWKVDEYVLGKTRDNDTEEIREAIINRFAAILLAPAEEFVQSAKSWFVEYGKQNKTITVTNFIKVIVQLMNKFFVPRKAVAKRMVELDFLPEETVNFLQEYINGTNSHIDDLIDDSIIEFGYIKFKKSSRKKWINGLAEVLNRADSDERISKSKIKKLREAFELEPLTANDESDEVVSYTTQEGIGIR